MYVEAQAPRNGARTSLVRSLRHRNFQLFFGGQLVSLIGTWMQSVAQAWLVYRLTGSSLLLGLVGFAGQIPVFLLAPVGGAVADRAPRRTVLLATQGASMLLAFGLAALTLLGHIAPWQVFVFAGALGIVNAFDIPARQAFVAELVGREDLANAIALNSSMFNGARAVGPAVAGALVSVIGEGWCFFVNAVSFVAVIAGLAAMRLSSAASAPIPGSALQQIAEGFRFVGHERAVRALLLLVGLLSLTAMPYAVLMPVFAARILGGGASSLGLLMGASGAGAVIGALLLAARRDLRGLGAWIAGSGAGLGACLILFAISRSFFASLAALVPLGMFMMIATAGANTLVQAMTPDALRGRVMAVYSMMFMGMAPVGALLAGALASRVGAPATVAAGGVVCAAGAAVFGARLATIRASGRALIAARRAEAKP